jgi:hypothetical protein
MATTDETITLPASIETLRIFRGRGISRMRVTQTYSGYRRFLTGSRIIEPGLREGEAGALGGVVDAGMAGRGARRHLGGLGARDVG